MVRSHTELGGGPRDLAGATSGFGARTGVGTYIHYLLAVSVLAGSALAGALAWVRSPCRTERAEPSERHEDGESGAR
ncbi:MAG: hypothetical protein OHK0013_40550 [Sandaracinaceae bacterium]